MSLPYENAKSGARAITELQSILRKFGCSKFATGEDYETGVLFIQFEHRGRLIDMKASSKGYAAAWLEHHPWTYRRQSTQSEWESKALNIGARAIPSVLRDWVKGQTTAIECGMFTFEAAFLSHIMLPSGVSVIQHIESENLLALPTGDQ